MEEMVETDCHGVYILTVQFYISGAKNCFMLLILKPNPNCFSEKLKYF